MGLVAEYEITCEELPFTDVVRAVPEATLEVEMQFNHGKEPPFIATVSHDAPGPVERAFDSSPFMGEYILVGQTGETHRYQVVSAVEMETQLGEGIADLDGLRDLATTDAIIERIRVTPTGWLQTGWFADRAALDEFRTFWQGNGGFDLRRLTRDGEPEEPGDGLTDPQREALRTAYEMGYFDVPRSTSLEAVADQFDITASALSERLRRAQTKLVETTMASTWPPLPE